MDESVLINGVLRSVLGGRRKRSRRALRYLTGWSGSIWSNPNLLLTAAGMAWGGFETLRQPQTPAGPVPESQPAHPPPPANGPAVADEALQVVRLAIAAAHADGTVTEEERAAILQHARAAGVAGTVEQELRTPRPLAEIVAGVADEGRKSTLYVLAFVILRGDEQPSGAERIFLAKLAHLVGLDPTTVQRLEESAARRIDAEEAPES